MWNSLDAELPLLTRLVAGAGELVTDWWWLMLLLIVVVVHDEHPTTDRW